MVVRESSRVCSAPRPARRPKRTHLHIESLEDRTVPTILFQPQMGLESAHDNGGLKLSNDIPVYTIFWGSGWNWDNPNGNTPSISSVRKALTSVVQSPYPRGLSEYNVNPMPNINQVYLDPSNPSPGGFSSSDIQGVVQHAMRTPDAQNNQLPHSP